MGHGRAFQVLFFILISVKQKSTIKIMQDAILVYYC